MSDRKATMMHERLLRHIGTPFLFLGQAMRMTLPRSVVWEMAYCCLRLRWKRCAIALFVSLYQPEDLPATVQANLAVAVSGLGDPALAEELFDLSLKHAGTRDERGYVYHQYVTYLLKKGHSGDTYAIQLIQKYANNTLAIAIAEGDVIEQANMHVILGDCAFPDDSCEAAEHYEKAISLAPDFGEAYYRLGHVHACDGNWEKAVDLLNRAVDIDSRSINAHYELGNALCYVKCYDDAENHFRKAIVLGYECPQKALYGQAYCAFHKGEYRRAERLARKAIQYDPEYTQPRTLLDEIGDKRRGSECT